MDEVTTQILRSIDKFDKVGADGVLALLQESTENFGAGLDHIRAQLIVRFLTTTGSTNEETLKNILTWFRNTARVMRRIHLIDVLDSMEIEPGYTKFDQLLDMPRNIDEQWSINSRPANIGFALDDILEAIQSQELLHERT